MSLPEIFNSPYFQAKHHILHQKLDPVLKMLTELSEANQSFIILWDEDYHQLYDRTKETQVHINLDVRRFKSRFSKLSQEVIYVPTIKLHTLFQEINFFKSYVNNEQLLFYPIIDNDNKVKGIAGIVLPATDIQTFDILSKMLESIGQYINHLFTAYLNQKRRSLPGYFNLEDLPASFFEMEINQSQEILYCSFSKTLIRKYPAFDQICSDEKKMLKILGIPCNHFYSLINQSKEKQKMEYVYGRTYLDGEKKYFLIKMQISKVEQGQYRCLGIVEDFTVQKAYGSVLDQMIFDISHIMRRPVVTMKGLTNLIDMDHLEKEDLKEISNKIKIVSNEMEDYIKAMFKIYEAKQNAIYHL